MPKPKTNIKAYTYIPYNDDESFDKVQSSNSQPRTIPEFPPFLFKEMSETENSNSLARLRKDGKEGQAEGEGQGNGRRGLFPFDCPGLWKVECKPCQRRLDEIGLAVGVNLKNNEVRRIIPLQTGKPSSLMKYAVEYENGIYEKFTSKALQKWYLTEMVCFLQAETFDQ